MNKKQNLIALDLEGVLIPEIWHQIATVTGVETLMLTTRDIADYDQLMNIRISALTEHNISLSAIQTIIKNDIAPFPGAVEFLRKLRLDFEVVLLSDTFTEFFHTLRPALEYPVIFCNSLKTENNMILEHSMRLVDGKKQAIKHFKDLNFLVAAAGDSYNDIHMLLEADCGFFYKASPKVVQEYPHILKFTSYETLYRAFCEFFEQKL